MTVYRSKRATTSRRSRIFLKRGPLSCEVPSRRDSVGGGVVAEFFRGLRKPTRFSGGGGSRRTFQKGGARVSKRPVVAEILR